MCIALLSTAHPRYKLILIDNRDEYINRPTAPAEWWPAHPSVLGGRDLHRPVQGTWLGVTKQGKIAVLTNYREDTTPSPTAVSRGEIIKKFLTETSDTETFVHEMIDSNIARDAGGFSLACGRIGESIAVISNRTRTQIPWICGDVVQTVGLSNTWFGDRSWPKVVDGEEAILKAIQENSEQHESEDDLVKALLKVLSDDALSRAGIDKEAGLTKHVTELRKTILVPPLGKVGTEAMKADVIAAASSDDTAKVLGSTTGAASTQLGSSGIYATHKQTVILVDQDERVRFVERTLFNNDCEPVSEEDGTIDITFQIE